MKRAGSAEPLIQCGVDLLFALKGERDRLESLGVDFRGHSTGA